VEGGEEFFDGGKGVCGHVPAAVCGCLKGGALDVGAEEAEVGEEG
jgi:hypothetical protein